MYFDEKGLIKPVKITFEGVKRNQLSKMIHHQTCPKYMKKILLLLTILAIGSSMAFSQEDESAKSHCRREKCKNKLWAGSQKKPRHLSENWFLMEQYGVPEQI